MVHLINNLFLAADEYCYIVGEKKPNDKRLKKVRYYSNITEAITNTANRAVRDSVQTGEVQTLNELCDKFRGIKEELTAAVKGECGE